MAQHSSLSRRSIHGLRNRIEPPKPRRAHRLLWAIGLLAICLITAVLYRRWLPVPEAETATLGYGAIEIAHPVDAWLVRRETVYRAPVGGVVGRLADEGKRVRVGTAVVSLRSGAVASSPANSKPPASMAAIQAELDQLSEQLYQLAMQQHGARDRGDQAAVARLQEEMDQAALRRADLSRQLGREEAARLPAGTGGAQSPGTPVSGASLATEVTTDSAGLLVYQVDGLEEQLTPEAAAQVTPASFRALKLPQIRTTAEGTVTAGEPLFKVVDNLSLGLLMVVPADGPILSQSAKLQLRLESGAELTARLVRLSDEGGERLLYLSVSGFPQELAGPRRMRATVILAKYSGLIAPLSAIDVRGGVQGIWVASGKQPSFHPVSVLGGDATTVALETDLAAGTEILRVAPGGMNRP